MWLGNIYRQEVTNNKKYQCDCLTHGIIIIIIIIIIINVRPTLERILYFTKSILHYLSLNARVHVISYYIVSFCTSLNVVGRFSRSRFCTKSLLLLTLNVYITVVLVGTFLGAPFSCFHILVLILSSDSLFLQWCVLLQLFSLARLRIVVAVQFCFI